jgi:hypothetical protein
MHAPHSFSLNDDPYLWIIDRVEILCRSTIIWIS